MDIFKAIRIFNHFILARICIDVFQDIILNKPLDLFLDTIMFIIFLFFMEKGL